MTRKILLLSGTIVLATVLIWGSKNSLANTYGFFSMPPSGPALEYGNILIDRTASLNGVKPVVFSHWIHRQKFTCEVCHAELGFDMVRNSTEITEEKIKAGEYCGACHDGTTAFSGAGQCGLCHNENMGAAEKKFYDLSLQGFPPAPFGNRIDWVQALSLGIIAPAKFLKSEVKQMSFTKELLLEAEWSSISPAIFPHKEHTEWLACGTCHPEIFNIKKKTTKHFTMTAILQGQFCGVCHLSVAFPINDCQRCHPGMEPM